MHVDYLIDKVLLSREKGLYKTLVDRRPAEKKYMHINI